MLKPLMAVLGLSGALLLCACAPGGSVSAPASSNAPTQSAEASACAARGGEMRQVGKLQSWRCVVKYADAGQRCTDKAQCQGDCLADPASHPAPGAPAAGICAADSNTFGCRTTIRDGKANATLCID
ncbi:hypothetical protein HMPREF0185_02082 [Brevundimonas diminuta 470-4]|nr:hypothetical protein HMPREF0185_02082 [Brevundimonas diminuta 470-4]